MALIIEDGSLPAGANSYITVADARAYAGARASTFPADDPSAEVLLIKSMDYLESFRARYSGAKYTKEQALQWPRDGAQVDGFDIETDEIPQVLKDAQAACAVELAAGVAELLPTNATGREVIRKVIDVLETEWTPGAGAAPLPIMRKVEALLRPLFAGGGLGLSTIRI